MKIQIKHRYNGSVLFETDAETIGDAVKAAILAKADLRYADLSSADLRYADLRYADLRYADLSYADLRYADLRYADLRYADLRSADLSEAKAAKKLAQELNIYRTILPDGDLIGWKKLQGGIICKLSIPAKADRVGGVAGRKCRAEYAVVLDGEGKSMRDGMVYKVGETVKPDKFDPNPLVECSNGIHFFITKREAEEYSS